MEVGIRTCQLFGLHGEQFILNPVLSRLTGNTAASAFASLKLDSLELTQFCSSDDIKWAHLLSDEHSANFRARRFVEIEFSSHPRQ